MPPTFRNIGRGMPYLHPTMVVRKNVFKSLEGCDTSFKIASDFAFVMRMMKKGFFGKYFKNHCPVEMDESGVSSTNEKMALAECWKSLKGSMTFIIFISFCERVCFFRSFILKENGPKEC